MRPTSMPSSWCAAAKSLGIDLVGPPRAQPILAGQGRRRLHPRPLRGRLGQAGGSVARNGGCPRPGAARSTRTGAPYVSVWFRRADCGPCPARPSCTRGQAPGPAPEAAPCGPSTRRSRPLGVSSRRRRAGAATRSVPGSRARSRRGCAPSGCAAAATAGWPKPICSTWRPRPPSTSSGSRHGSHDRHTHLYLALRRPRRLTRLRQRYPNVFLDGAQRSRLPAGTAARPCRGEPAREGQSLPYRAPQLGVQTRIPGTWRGSMASRRRASALT